MYSTTPDTDMPRSDIIMSLNRYADSCLETLFFGGLRKTAGQNYRGNEARDRGVYWQYPARDRGIAWQYPARDRGVEWAYLHVLARDRLHSHVSLRGHHCGSMRACQQ